MSQKRYHVQLSAHERQQLESYVKHGKPAARGVTRARILLLADADYGDEELREVLGVSRPTVTTRRRKAQEHAGKDIREVLQDAPRPGQPVKLDSRVAAHVALIACSEAPPGPRGGPCS
jgi:putative transposase